MTKPSTPRPAALNPIFLAALLCLGASATARAQAPAAAAAGSAAEAEPASSQVIVTGSRIRGIAPIGASVSQVTRASIESSGAVSTAQILQEVPQIFNLGVSENSRGQSGGSPNITYASGINLRGIGPYATLTLLNGHRVVGQGTLGITVDPSIIPAFALERVEVVADGASAIYGSDAVAGVANLILRRDTGAEFGLRYGQADGYSERQIGGLLGTRWRGGQVAVTLEHTWRDSLSGRDRDFFRADLRGAGGGDFRANQCSPGTIIINGVNYPIPQGGVTPANAAQLVAGPANRCDNLKVQDLIPRQERNSMAFVASHELTPGTTLTADGFATRREYRYEPGYLSSTLNVPSTNPFYVRPPGAPAGSSQQVAYSFANDLPVNTNNGYSETWQLSLGAETPLPAGWKLSGLASIGNNDDVATTLGGLNNGAVNAALANTNPATALNVFGGATNPATLAGIANNIAISPGETRFVNYLLKADGGLFDLPGGKLRAALGLERQEIETTGGQTSGPASNPTTGMVTLERTVDSAFAELYVPLVGESMGLPGMRRLDLVAAVRADRYSDVGNTDNPKLGLNWVPLDGLVLRVSHGTSFRAPGLAQIRPFTNGGRGGLFVQNYTDPSIGGTARVGVALNGANPDLKPETARTRTLGFDWQPAFAPQTRLSMTWFDIVYEDQIVGYLSDLLVLNREASFEGTGVIQRNPSASTVAQLIASYPVSAGVLPQNWTLFVDGRAKNLAKSVSRGFDFELRSRLQAGSWGDFTLGFNGTVFTKYDVAPTANSPLVAQLNNIYNPVRLKARASVQWNRGHFNTSVYLNHTGAYNNNLANPVQRVGSHATLDFRVAYALDGLSDSALLRDTTVALGVTNAFDRDPPFVNVAPSQNGGGGFDPTLASPLGRLVSISLNKKF